MFSRKEPDPSSQALVVWWRHPRGIQGSKVNHIQHRPWSQSLRAVSAVCSLAHSTLPPGLTATPLRHNGPPSLTSVNAEEGMVENTWGAGHLELRPVTQFPLLCTRLLTLELGSGAAKDGCRSSHGYEVKPNSGFLFQCRIGIGKLWASGQIRPAVCCCKFSFVGTRPRTLV